MECYCGGSQRKTYPFFIMCISVRDWFSLDFYHGGGKIVRGKSGKYRNYSTVAFLFFSNATTTKTGNLLRDTFFSHPMEQYIKCHRKSPLSFDKKYSKPTSWWDLQSWTPALQNSSINNAILSLSFFLFAVISRKNTDTTNILRSYRCNPFIILQFKRFEMDNLELLFFCVDSPAALFPLKSVRTKRWVYINHWHSLEVI